MAKKTQYQHKLQYNNAYNRQNYRSFSVRFSLSHEQDVIDWLEGQDGVKAYLNQLIVADMQKHSKKKKAAPKTTKAPAKKAATVKKKKKK